MSRLKDFTVPSARQLPVILMADVSGSMAADGKIDALNSSVAEMIAAFAEEDDIRADIYVAVVTFGGEEARLHLALQAARRVRWEPMRASGGTPMGGALTLVTEFLEDRERVPSQAYLPAIILVSDGLPNDSWEEPLKRLLSSESARKAQRFALGIGADANHDILRMFIADLEGGRIFEAHEARQIRKSFRWITNTVVSRSRSVEPNAWNLEDFKKF